MADDELRNTPEDEVSPAKKAGIPMVVIIVVVAIVVGAGGFFAGKMMSGGNGENGKQNNNVEQTADQTNENSKKNDKNGKNENQQTKPDDGVIDGEIKDDVEEDPKESDDKKAADTDAVKKNPGILILDEFTVNLNDPFGRRYSNIFISLEVVDKEIVAKIKTNELLIPKIRNEILMIISSKSYNELKTTSGKITLKEEILMRLNEILQEQFNEDVIKSVWFTKFLIQ